VAVTEPPEPPTGPTLGPFPPTFNRPPPAEIPVYGVSPLVRSAPAFRPAQTSGFAVASLVLGLVGLLLACCSFGVPSALAVIFGHIGVAQTRSGRKVGTGMAVGGLVIGYLVVLPAVLVSTWFVFGGGGPAWFWP
jgi:hypothetical protein